MYASSAYRSKPTHAEACHVSLRRQGLQRLRQTHVPPNSHGDAGANAVLVRDSGRPSGEVPSLPRGRARLLVEIGLSALHFLEHAGIRRGGAQVVQRLISAVWVKGVESP